MERLLTETNFQRYFFSFQGYMFNHLSHGIIALARLGASEPRIQQFVDW